jgi:hypothetical protein
MAKRKSTSEAPIAAKSTAKRTTKRSVKRELSMIDQIKAARQEVFSAVLQHVRSEVVNDALGTPVLLSASAILRTLKTHKGRRKDRELLTLYAGEQLAELCQTAELVNVVADMKNFGRTNLYMMRSRFTREGVEHAVQIVLKEAKADDERKVLHSWHVVG